MSALMDVFLALQAEVDAELQAAAAAGHDLSIALLVTDGQHPRDGTILRLTTGRYRQGDGDYDPDEQAAAEQRATIREAIGEHLGESADFVDREALTDDVVAALAGE